MRSESEQYLYELPDYIQGNATAEVAKAIEDLLYTDSAFLAEYEALKQTMGEIDGVVPAQNSAMQAEIPTGYFHTFAENVQQKIHVRPAQRNFRQEILHMFSCFFSPAPVAEFGTAVAGFAVVVVLFSFAFTWQDESNPNLEAAGTTESLSAAEDNLLATLNFVNNYASFSSVLSMSEEEASQMMESINQELPASARSFDAEPSYEVLSEEEALEILNLL